MKKEMNSILLTRQELQIMKVIWERGAATVKNVYAVISKRKPTAYTTILTIMGILESKGVLTHTKSGRAFIYRPVLTKQQATRNHVHDIIDRFFDGNPDRLIANIRSNNMNEVNATEQDVQPNVELRASVLT
ncbi:MAG: BlaI/MecI/CopY family transcriptional regulator, partial [Acidobacteriota bacterium]